MKHIKEYSAWTRVDESGRDPVEGVYLQSRELREIGKLSEYRQYLDSVFPESKVSGLVYHGGTLKGEDRGKDEFTGDWGLYFTGSESRAKSYIKAGGKEYGEKSRVWVAKLDIQNPLPKKVWSRWKFGSDRITGEEVRIMKRLGSDGIIDLDPLSRWTPLKYGSQYVVLEMSQVLVLGSARDVEGFREWASAGLRSPDRRYL
jgi:hypothetical protein